MKEYIINEVTKIFHNCITAFMKKYPGQVVSILIRKGTEDESKLRYSVCVDHIPQIDVKFLEILGKKIDLTGMSLIVPPKIKEILENFEQEFASTEIAVTVYQDDREDCYGDIRFHVFADGNVKKEFTLDEVILIGD